MRLIDADALMERIKFCCTDCQYEDSALCRACGYGAALDAIDDMPTIDEVPVVHGRWIDAHRWTPEVFACSICGETTNDTSFGVPRANYCPWCGAKMDEEGE